MNSLGCSSDLLLPIGEALKYQINDASSQIIQDVNHLPEGLNQLAEVGARHMCLNAVGTRVPVFRHIIGAERDVHNGQGPGIVLIPC